MYPVGFDKSGSLFVHGPSETPQWAPGVVADPARNSDSESIPLTINKLRNLNQKGSFSSQRAGHEASYALDNWNGTWWEPAEDDKAPSIMFDLASVTEFDPQQEFIVDSMRIEFVARGGFGALRSGAQPMSGPVAHQYRIEVSLDGNTFTTIRRLDAVWGLHCSRR
jgi:xylan 1,4-beta-xylosidase